MVLWVGLELNAWMGDAGNPTPVSGSPAMDSTRGKDASNQVRETMHQEVIVAHLRARRLATHQRHRIWGYEIERLTYRLFR